MTGYQNIALIVLVITSGLIAVEFWEKNMDRYGKRLDNCPIRALPEKKPIQPGDSFNDAAQMLFNQGYNVCLETILGEMKEETT